MITALFPRLRTYFQQWTNSGAFSKSYRHLIHLSLPNSCLLCEEQINHNSNVNQDGICPSCHAYFIRPRHTCQRCALPLINGSTLCAQCLKTPPAFERTFSPFLYQTPLDSLIKQFKHTGQFRVGHILAKVFSDEVRHYYSQNHLLLPDYIVPMPLHWRRQWQRGFNQSMLLSNTLAKQFQIPLFEGCKKVVATQMQEKLNRQQRLKNLRGVFLVPSEAAQSIIKGKHCVIVDDVMTTGATVNSLARALKHAGAGTIHVWTLARTPK